MALVKGICKNFGECDLADGKEIQEVDKTNFVCEECGKPLFPVEGGGGGTTPPNKKAIVFGGIAAAVALIGGGAFFALSGGGPEIEKIQLNQNQLELNISQEQANPSEQLQAKALDADGKEIADAELTYVWEIDKTDVATVTPTGEVTAVKEGDAVVTVKVEGDDKLKASCQVKVNAPVVVEEPVKEEGKVEKVEKPTKPQKDVDSGNGYGKVNLGYGVYEGYRKNGKPHGHGTITYKTTHKIVSWKDFEASPGDTFEGEFRDGKITGMGYWHHDGNVTAIQ